MLRDYLVKDPDAFEELEISDEDFQAIRAVQNSRGVQTLLKVCVSRIMDIEREFFNPMRETPLNEVESWGFIQARSAYYAIADLIMNPPVEEPGNE